VILLILHVAGSHVLAAGSLWAAILLIGPAALRAALMAAYNTAMQQQPAGRLRVFFLAALQIFKDEYNLGALLAAWMAASGQDAAAAVEAAVVDRLHFARLLVQMYQVLVRAPPAADALRAASAGRAAAAQAAAAGAGHGDPAAVQ
jgi:hypothetical protein